SWSCPPSSRSCWAGPPTSRPRSTPTTPRARTTTRSTRHTRTDGTSKQRRRTGTPTTEARTTIAGPTKNPDHPESHRSQLVMTIGHRESSRPTRGPHRSVRWALAIAAPALLLTAGCRHADRGESPGEKAKNEQGSTAGIRVIHPVQRDIRMAVVQPGTLEAFETTPVYSRISGYVQKYNYNIGDRVKQGDVLIDMWIPDIVQQHQQTSAQVRQADVQISVMQKALRAAEARLETAVARIDSAKAGVDRAQASYTRWESEYKRLEQLVAQRVLDVQVRAETYPQFEEAAAARDQANADLAESRAARDQAEADRDRAQVDVDAARVARDVAKEREREAWVLKE